MSTFFTTYRLYWDQIVVKRGNTHFDCENTGLALGLAIDELEFSLIEEYQEDNKIKDKDLGYVELEVISLMKL